MWPQNREELLEEYKEEMREKADRVASYRRELLEKNRKPNS